MGNATSVNNNVQETEILSKIQNILGGSDTETMVSNLLAVSGDTDNLDAIDKNQVFETTSEENMFTQTEDLVPIVKYSRDEDSNSFTGGNNESINFSLQKLHQLLQETEINITSNMELNGGNPFNKLRQLFEQTENEYSNSLTDEHSVYMNKLSNLLGQDETEYNSFLTGGSDQNMNKLRQLLEQTETEYNNLSNVINFKGGALEDVSLFNGGNMTINENHEEEQEELKKEELKKEEEQKEHDDDDTDQSGGSSEKLDSELVEILKSLKQNKDNSNPKGGKSRKTSKKSKSSKKSKKSKSSKKSRRVPATTEYNTETTYMNNDDTDASDLSEDYLTSTSSINTSDINIKHYKN
jgi:hypothetical protein